MVYESLMNRKTKSSQRDLRFLCVKLECAKFCAWVQVLSFLRVWECLRVFQHTRIWPLYIANGLSIYREKVWKVEVIRFAR